MNEAPKKIVLGFDYDGFPAIGGDTLYIRADIVDELVEALEDIRDYEFSHRYIKDITRAALAKARGEDEMIHKPKKVKKEGWLNIYSEQDIDLFQTRKEADDNAVYGRKACIHITWEEEE